MPKGTRPIGRAREIVKAISDIIKEEDFKRAVGIKASEIFVGGSLGQGTINYEDFDIDLVIFSTSLHPTKGDDPIDGYKDILKKLDAYLKENLDGYTLSQKEDAIDDYKLTCTVKEYKIDLLLSPLWDSRDEFYEYLRKLETEKRRKFSVSAHQQHNTVYSHVTMLMLGFQFSVSALKYQVEFMRPMPNRLKILVARFKGWRNKIWADSTHGEPKSYCLTLLMTVAYSRAPQEIKQARKIKRLSNW